MADTYSVATLLESTTSKIQQLQKAFIELESHRAVTLNMKWKQLEEHFHGLEKSLKRRFNELEDQEKKYVDKTINAQEILVKREADIIAKEEASLERLQEKRDAAVFSISNAPTKHKKACVKPFVFTSGDRDMALSKDDKAADTMISVGTLNDVKMFSQNKNVEVKSFPQLVHLCQENDSAGVHKFILDNRKNLAAIKEELPLALQAAVDPASLVLDSLKGFYNGESRSLDGKKDSNLLGVLGRGRESPFTCQISEFISYCSGSGNNGLCLYDSLTDGSREQELWKRAKRTYRSRRSYQSIQITASL